MLVENTLAKGYWSQHDESFCEEALRFPDGGGVAIVGASRGTTARFNEKLIQNLFGAMYREYAGGTVLRESDFWIAFERMGDVFRFGRFGMVSWLASPSGLGKPTAAFYNQQAYHLFGDPMLRVRPPRRNVMGQYVINNKSRIISYQIDLEIFMS